MFKSSELGDELQALKSEMSRLLNTSADDMFDAAKSSAEALAEQIKERTRRNLERGRRVCRTTDRGAANCGAGIRLRARHCHRFHVEEALT